MKTGPAPTSDRLDSSPLNMNPLLVSLCNFSGPRRTGLWWVESATMTRVPVELGIEDGIAGCTGLACDERRIVVAARAWDGKLSAVFLDPASLAPLFAAPLPADSDPHSLILKDGFLYAACTGSDAINRWPVGDLRLGKMELVWIASPSGADTHHVNSLAFHDGELYASAFGPRTGDSWAGSDQGYIINVSKGVRVAQQLRQPHSLLAHLGKLFYCESGAGKVARLDGPSWTLRGYTRGLAIDRRAGLVVGLSGRRGLSKSTRRIIASDSEAPDFARLIPLDIQSGATGAEIPLGLGGQEIFDILPAASLPGAQALPSPVEEDLQLMVSWTSNQQLKTARQHAALTEQEGWNRSLRQDLLDRDETICSLQEQVKEQTRWAQATADTLKDRDALIRTLQAQVKEQSDWGQRSSKALEQRDAKILELASAADAGRERLEKAQVQLRSLEEMNRALAERLEQRETTGLQAEFARLREGLRQLELSAEARAEASAAKLESRLASVQSTLDNSLEWRLRGALRQVLGRLPGGTLRISRLHPTWAVVGDPFNVQSDGHSHISIEGSGFGGRVVAVVDGIELETFRASDGLVSAKLPHALCRRSAAMPVWVENRDGGGDVSNILCFRLLPKSLAKAYLPAMGRRRLLKAVRNRAIRAAAALWWRAQVPAAVLRRDGGRLLRRLGLRRAADEAESTHLTASMAHHLRPAALPRKADVVCFSIIDWDFRYQRPQQLLSRLAAKGHRVFYLSQRFLGPGDPPFRLRAVRPGVTEVFLRAPRAMNIYQDALEDADIAGLEESLGWLKAVAGLGESVCFVQLPFWTPLALRLKKAWGAKVVFDCLDDFGGFGNMAESAKALELRLAGEADLVIATSKVLAAKHADREPALIPNGAECSHFGAQAAPAALSLPAGPVFGYYGAISHWFDAELLAGAAAARPGWQFVLIGQADAAVAGRLKGLPNVHLLGEKPYAQLPSYLARFDVCLIPFIVDDLIKATNPVKFFEYLAAGKPVVAARMPELEPFGDDCHLYEGLDAFLAQAQLALDAATDPAAVASRRELAARNDWEERVDALDRAVRSLHPKASVVVVTYNNLELTRACFDSLLKKTAYGDWELLVVDNNSTDGTPDYLRKLEAEHPFVRVILNDSNRGFAGANNQGIRAAQGEYVVLLNNDTVVTHGWLGRLLLHLDDPAVGMVGPVTNNIGNEARIETDYADMAAMEAFAADWTARHAGRSFDIPMLAMFCVAMRRPLFERVGLLDERYEIGMFEDDDFSRSVKNAGLRVVCAEDVFIHHVGGGSFKKLDPEVYKRIFDSNKKRYEEKWGEAWVPHQYRSPAEPKAALKP